MELCFHRMAIRSANVNSGVNWTQTTLEDFHAGTGFQVDVEQTPGSIALSREGDNYITEGTFESSSFDSGCLSNFDAIWWDATVLNEGELKFQIPTSENGETWTGLLGPDGTSNTYYDSSGESISLLHSSQRYIKWKAYFSNTEASTSPKLHEVRIMHSAVNPPPPDVEK